MKITVPIECNASFDDNGGEIKVDFKFKGWTCAQMGGKLQPLPQPLQMDILTEVHRTLSVALAAMGAIPATGVVTFSPSQEQGDKSVAHPLSTLFPFEHFTTGYFRAKGYPVGKPAPLLHGMNAIRYLHAVMTGADPKPFLCSEKEGEL